MSASFEANSFSTNQKILHLLWKPNFHYCVNIHLPLGYVLCQMNTAPRYTHFIYGLL